jgi:hypothetical protein
MRLQARYFACEERPRQSSFNPLLSRRSVYATRFSSFVLDAMYRAVFSRRHFHACTWSTWDVKMFSIVAILAEKGCTHFSTTLQFIA